MGAAVSTAQQPLAEVDIKNEIGVLYDEEAQQAFAAATEDNAVVAWPKVQAYAEAHGLLLMQRALAIFERELGHDHPNVVSYRGKLESQFLMEAA